MKVVFIYPPQPQLLQPMSYIPLGIAYMGAVLEAAGVEVEAVNLAAYESIEDVKYPDADWYGVSCVSATHKVAEQIVDSLKGRGRVVLGGAHPSVEPDKVRAESNADIVVAGEAEYLMRDLVLGDVEPQPLMDAGYIRDLDTLLYPARHLFHKSNIIDYTGIHGQEKGTPATTVLTSRGCSYACLFCCKAHKMLSRYRYRSPSNTVGELMQIMDNYGVEHVRFVDDEFTLNMGNTMKLMKTMGNLELTWVCITRVDALNRELVKEMKLSGCREIHVGVETGSDKLLHLMNKQTTSKDLLEGVKMIKQEGVRVKTYLMTRFPGETEEDREATIRWISEAKPDKLTLSVFTPLPGSEIAETIPEGSPVWYYRDDDEEFLQYRSRLMEAAGID